MINDEYATKNMKEMLFLRDKGIRYSFSYKTKDNMVVWKFIKNKELFDALIEYWRK